MHKCTSRWVGKFVLLFSWGVHHTRVQVKELAAPGDLQRSTNFDFEFNNVEKQHETYTGINARLR